MSAQESAPERATRSPVAGVFDAAGVGMIVLQASGDVAAANPRAVRLLGGAQLSARDVFAADSGLILGVADTRVVDDRADATFRRLDGSLLPVWWVAAPLGAPDTPDGPTGVIVVFDPLTDVKATAVADAADREQDRADLSSARRRVSDMAWVAELMRSVSGTLDQSDALLRLADLVVPRLADVALVDLIDEHGDLIRVGGRVAPGFDIDLDAALARLDPRVGDESTITRDTLLSDPVLLLTAAELADPAVLGEASRQLLVTLGARTAVIVPLAARGHRVGVLGLIRRAGRPDFGTEDLLLAQNVGSRVGLLLDNARLFGAEQRNAATLQRALLPDLTGDGPLPVAARYLPARERHRVGGDWYDLFARDDGTSVVVIGDVAGHDLTAATTMAAMRNLLRGVAIAVPDGPARVLRLVDRNLAPLAITGTATVWLGAVAADGAGGWTVLWSNAGHPPPLLIEPDGGVRVLDSPPDRLLGTGSDSARTDHRAVVPADSTLLLYTDGLIETRSEDIDVSMRRLVGAVRSAAGLRADLDALLDAVVRVLPRSPDDDTALLAVRLI